MDSAIYGNIEYVLYKWFSFYVEVEYNKPFNKIITRVCYEDLKDKIN